MNETDRDRALSLKDTIRANQLIRGGIDEAGFDAWCRQSSAYELTILTAQLYHFACQAGVDENLWSEALGNARLEPDDSAVVGVHRVIEGFGLNLEDLHYYLLSCTAEDRKKCLRLFSHLFALAEGRVFEAECKDRCNHWWHRDLLDERFVDSLLRDPDYDRTSMSTDDLIKQQSE